MIVTDDRPRLEHTVTVSRPSAVSIERMCTWCHEQFGRRFSIVDRGSFGGRDGTWQCLYDGRPYDSRGREPITYIFSFDHEQDAVLFSLRWL